MFLSPVKVITVLPGSKRISLKAYIREFIRGTTKNRMSPKINGVTNIKP
jgi:hypothetical protein